MYYNNQDVRLEEMPAPRIGPGELLVKVLASGESHIAAKPRSSADASFPAAAGMDTLKLEFIHPDGRSVYAVSLHIK